MKNVDVVRYNDCLKNKKGITLIALVVTIVVLLILAGVTILTLTGENGLLERARIAKEKTDNVTDKENNNLANYENKINEYLNSSREGYISQNIEDFTPNIDFINGTYITVAVPEITVKNSSEIVGYAYLLNGKVKGYTTEKTYSFEGLEFETSYDIQIIAMDEDGKIKLSKEITQATIDKLYLYKEGNECILITGGWQKTGYDWHDYGTFTKNSNNMYIYSPSSSRIYCGNKRDIDLTNYTKLYIESNSTTNTYLATISKVDYYNNSFGTDLVYKSGEYIDIDNYNDRYYIHITVANGCDNTIQKIWLEK